MNFIYFIFFLGWLGLTTSIMLNMPSWTGMLAVASVSAILLASILWIKNID